MPKHNVPEEVNVPEQVMNEHVLVLSAGESLLKNYIATIRALTPPPTDVYIICEETVYNGEINPNFNEERRQRQVEINEGVQSAILNAYYGQMLHNGNKTLDMKLGTNGDGTTRIVECNAPEIADDIINQTQQITLLQDFATLPQTIERFNIIRITEIDVTEIRLQNNNNEANRGADIDVPEIGELSVVLQAIYQKHKNVKLTFNLSGGLNELKFNMFLLALWCGADVCLTPRDDQGAAQYRPLPIPKVPVRDLNERECCILKIIADAERRGLNNRIDYKYLLEADDYKHLLIKDQRNCKNDGMDKSIDRTNKKRKMTVYRDVAKLSVPTPTNTLTADGLGLIEDIGDGNGTNFRLTLAGRLAYQYLPDDNVQN